MIGKGERKQANEQNQAAKAPRVAARHLAGAALLLAGIALVLTLGGSASASDDACPLGAYEVNIAFGGDNPGNCQWDAVQDVLGLGTIAPSDVVLIRNGTYNISWNLTTDGLSFIGDSEAGVLLDGQGNGPAIRILANLTSLTTLTLRTDSTGALNISAGTSHTALYNVTLRASGTFALDTRGDAMFVRNLTAVAQRGISVRGAGHDFAGVTVDSTLALGVSKMSVGATGSTFSTVTLRGTTTAAGLHVVAGASAVTLTNVSIVNTSNAIQQETAFAMVYMGLNLQAFTVIAINIIGPATSSAVVDGAVIVGSGVTTNGINSNDAELTVSNASIRNVNGGIFHSGQNLTLTNVSFDTMSAYAVYRQTDGGTLRWSGGSVNRAPYGFQTATPWAIGVSGNWISNVSFSNISNHAVFLSTNASSAWSQFTIVDCSITDANAGLQLGGSSTRPGASFVIARNRFTNVSLYGLTGFFALLLMDDNTLVGVRLGINIELSQLDLPQNWNSVATTNTIDGQPIYYLLNVSDVTLPSVISQVFMVNVTNVTLSGAVQTSAYNGVNAVRSSRVTVTDSVLLGNASMGFVCRLCAGVTVRNVTVPNSLTGLMFDNVTGGTIDAVAAPMARVVQLLYSQRITVTNISDGGGYALTILAVRNSALVTAEGVRASFVEGSFNAVIVDLSNGVTVRNVSFTGGFRALFVTNSQDLTFQDWAINNTRVGFELLAAQRVLLERIAVSSNFTSFNIIQSPFVTLRQASVSTFTNPVTWDRSADGRLLDILVAGRAPARGVFADQSDRFSASNVTVSFGNIIAFHLGTLSGAVLDNLMLSAGSGGIPGGRGIEMNLAGVAISNVRVDGFDYGFYATLSAVTILRAVQTSAGITGLYVGQFSQISTRDSSFESILGPAVYLNNPTTPALTHSDFVSQQSWGGRFGNADGAAVIECNFTSGAIEAAYFESTSNNFSVRHSNFWGTGVLNPGGQGGWDGGFPAGGNYYAWAAPTLLDQFTGPLQAQAGYDGLADSSYDVGGASGSLDMFPLMDPWPPKAWLTSPQNGSLIAPGTLLNFTISNFFSFVDWSTDTGQVGTLAYPHDVDTSTWADGTHTVTVVAYDIYAPTVGVVATFIVDGTPPTVTALPALGTESFARGATIQLSASDAHLVALEALLDGALLTGTSITVSTAGLGDGLHTLAITATDEVGNVFTYLWTFNIDATPPSLAIVEPGSPIFVRPGDILHYDAQDASGIAVANYTAVPVGGGPARTGTLASGGANRALSTSGWSDDCYDVTVTARDNVGFETSVSRVVCVDGTEPDLSLLQDPYFVDEDAPFVMPGGAVTDLDDELVFSWAVGVSGGSVTLDGVSPTFVFADPGNFTVIATVRDRMANIGQRSFTVVVADLTDPLASFELPAEWDEDVPLALSASGATDNSGAPLTYLWSSAGPSGFDTASGISPFLTFAAPGLHTVTLKVTDRSLNNASVAHQVLVKDTTAPTLVVTGAKPSVNQGAVMRLDASLSTDNDPGSSVTIVWRIAQGGTQVERIGATLDYTFDGAGTYSVNITATDAAGNAAFENIVINANALPKITRGPVGSAVEGVHITWPMSVMDPDAGDAVTLRLVSGPAGMTVLNNELVWTTPLASAGVYTVVIEASDGKASANFTYDVQVTAAAGATTGQGDSTGLWILLLLVAAGVALVVGKRMGAGKRRSHDDDASGNARTLDPAINPPPAAHTLDPAINPPMAWQGGRGDFSDVGEASASLSATQAEGEAEAGVGSQAEGKPRGGRRGGARPGAPKGTRAALRGESSEGELDTDRE